MITVLHDQVGIHDLSSSHNCFWIQWLYTILTCMTQSCLAKCLICVKDSYINHKHWGTFQEIFPRYNAMTRFNEFMEPSKLCYIAYIYSQLLYDWTKFRIITSREKFHTSTYYTSSCIYVAMCLKVQAYS